MGTPQLEAPHPYRNPAATVMCPSLVKGVCKRPSRVEVTRHRQFNRLRRGRLNASKRVRNRADGGHTRR
jgi:hypothetical protein